MADFRHAMMEKFRKMKRQREAREQNKKDIEDKEKTSKRERRKKGDGDETTSKRERRKKRDKDKEEEDGGGGTGLFSLISKRERRRKKTLSGNDKNKAERKRIKSKGAEMFGLGVDGIIQQYNTYLKTFIPPNSSHTAFDKNMNKNRYKDVVCIDQTRVVLLDRESDYIHANYVKGDPFLNSFICTQGPLPLTADDFWVMIMQEKVSNIVMLCNVVEAGKNKCFQYWPQEVGASLTFGDVEVKNAEVDENKDTTYILSTLEAESKGRRLTIKHLRWKNWPDKGVPSSVMAPFRILKQVRQSLSRPTVVHCSAGIGRTGCIVAIEMALQQILSGRPLAIIQMVKQLRTMRMSSIQTDEQLVYVVRCLVAYAEACGMFNSRPELQEKAEKFISEYDSMLLAKKPPSVPAATPGSTPSTTPSPSPAPTMVVTPYEGIAASAPAPEVFNNFGQKKVTEEQTTGGTAATVASLGTVGKGEETVPRKISEPSQPQQGEKFDEQPQKPKQQLVEQLSKPELQFKIELQVPKMEPFQKPEPSPMQTESQTSATQLKQLPQRADKEEQRSPIKAAQELPKAEQSPISAPKLMQQSPVLQQQQKSPVAITPKSDLAVQQNQQLIELQCLAQKQNGKLGVKAMHLLVPTCQPQISPKLQGIKPMQEPPLLAPTAGTGALRSTPPSLKPGPSRPPKSTPLISQQPAVKATPR